MNPTVHIPDDLVGQLSAAGGDLSRRALEALAAEEYKHDRITRPELRGKMLSANAKAFNAWAFDAFGCGRYQPPFLPRLTTLSFGHLAQERAAITLALSLRTDFILLDERKALWSRSAKGSMWP